MDLKDALYNALKEKDRAETSNPLVVEGQKLIPSVTRVFRRQKDLFVYLQAYQPGAETVQPLVAFVTFYKGQSKAFETQALQVNDGPVRKLKTVEFKFSLPLSKFDAGDYTCQVTVLDPATQKAAFWQAPIVVIE